jgi:phage/plasmid-like protein (TIGR03299 family)
MAHELDFTNGRANMFSVRETPWHRLGQVLTDAPSFNEAIALSGADYLVALRPLQYLPRGAAETSPTGQGFAVVREDREGTADGVLAIVGERYEPVQNRDAFSILEPLVDAGVASLETGGVLRGGRDAWLLVRFQLEDERVRQCFGDEVLPFGLVTTNHSGARRVLLAETPIRVVCANTLSSAVSGMRKDTSIAVAHRAGATVKVVEAARELFAGVTERYVAVAEAYQRLRDTRLTVEQFAAAVLDTVAPMPDPNDFDSKRGFSIVADRQLDRRKLIGDAWDGGIGHTGDRSAWEAFNAAAEVIDHDVDAFPAKDRIAQLSGGRLAQLKDATLAAILAVK